MEVYVVLLTSLDSETPIAVCRSFDAVSTITGVDQVKVQNQYEKDGKKKAFILPRGETDIYVVRIFNLID